MKKLSFLALFTLFFGIAPTLAATYFSRTNGDWNVASTWSTIGYGGAAAGAFPIAGDVVNIGGGNIVSITANQACASINFDGGSSSSNQLVFTGAFSLTVSGGIVIARPTAAVANTFTVDQGSVTAASIDFSNTGAGSGTHAISISTGSISISGNITNTGGGTSPSISISGAGQLLLGGSLYPSGQGTFSAATGSTVTYNGASPQTVQSFNLSGNLALSGSGAKTLGGALTVTGNLTIADATSFSVGGFNFQVTGSTTIGTGTGGSFSITNNTGNKVFVGQVTLNSGASWVNSGNEAVAFGGGINNNGGSFSAGTATQTFSTNSQTLTGNLTIPAVTVQNANVVVTLNGVLVCNTLNVATNSASILNNNSLTINNTLTLSGFIT